MDIEKILNTVIFSDDMKKHLLNGGLERSCSEIEEIIFSSPIAIEVKYELLKEIDEEVRKDEKNRIADTDKSEKDHKIWCHNYRMDEFDSYLMNLRVALEKNISEGVFVCELCDYDEDTVATDIGFECICGSFDEAVEWVREDINGGEYTLEDTHWHKVSLYLPFRA